jgi:hypothetical protein
MPAGLRVPFGWKDERLWEPRQVPNGKGCGCVCPACQRPLIAKQNHPTPHFAHAPGADCPKALETAIHLAAKQLIADRQALRLPVLTFTNPYARPNWGRPTQPETIYVERTIPLSDVRLEEWLGDIRPDIVVTSGAHTYLVEIAVTHFVDDAKQAKIDARQVPTVEIDLRGLRRQTTFAELADVLFTANPYPAEWRYHPRIVELTQAAKQEAEIACAIAEQAWQAQEAAEKAEAETRRAEAAANAAALDAEMAKIRKYRELPADRKLAVNCRYIALTPAQLGKLTTFVPWENKWYCPRAVWQSAALAFFAHQQAQQDEICGRYLPAEIDPKLCLSWLELRFPIDPANDGEKHAVAYWKYINFMLGIGVLWKGKGLYFLNIPPTIWVGMQVIKPPKG